MVYSPNQVLMLNAMLLREMSTFMFTDWLLTKFGKTIGMRIAKAAKKHEFT